MKLGVLINQTRSVTEDVTRYVTRYVTKGATHSRIVTAGYTLSLKRESGTLETVGGTRTPTSSNTCVVTQLLVRSCRNVTMVTC